MTSLRGGFPDDLDSMFLADYLVDEGRGHFHLRRIFHRNFDGDLLVLAFFDSLIGFHAKNDLFSV
ncbi:MAG: hypothetical protein A4E42_00663 [Methanoregulaceae archaeon PtaU1.Bin222]|nr:MAG: hypothetical protein A4E42_00663 [Methanoregulaceae archaeon PtaU1.Bin222]